MDLAGTGTHQLTHECRRIQLTLGGASAFSKRRRRCPGAGSRGLGSRRARLRTEPAVDRTALSSGSLPTHSTLTGELVSNPVDDLNSLLI